MTPVWVRLPNPSIHFWTLNFLAYIGNDLGYFIKIDINKVDQGLFTFTQISIELDLNHGLPNTILIVLDDSTYTQSLDYENVVFHY